MRIHHHIASIGTVRLDLAFPLGPCVDAVSDGFAHLTGQALDVGGPFRFVELAEEINSSMSGYVARRIQDLLNDAGKAVRGSNILLLGVTYKANIADERVSPAVPLATRLGDMGAKISYHDPHVPAWGPEEGQRIERVADLGAALASADLTVLLQTHQEYDPDYLTK